jgi:hypothetical protein
MILISGRTKEEFKEFKKRSQEQNPGVRRHWILDQVQAISIQYLEKRTIDIRSAD